MRLVFTGNNNRSVSATEANATSSRSHAILQIRVTQSSLNNDFCKSSSAILSIIDIAGSERACASNNKGDRRTEGMIINIIYY